MPPPPPPTHPPQKNTPPTPQQHSPHPAPASRHAASPGTGRRHMVSRTLACDATSGCGGFFPLRWRRSHSGCARVVRAVLVRLVLRKRKGKAKKKKKEKEKTASNSPHSFSPDLPPPGRIGPPPPTFQHHPREKKNTHTHVTLPHPFCSHPHTHTHTHTHPLSFRLLYTQVALEPTPAKREEKKKTHNKLPAGMGEGKGEFRDPAPALASCFGHPAAFAILLPAMHAVCFVAARGLAQHPLVEPAWVWAVYVVCVFVVPALRWVTTGPQVWAVTKTVAFASASPQLCVSYIRDPDYLPLWSQPLQGAAAGPELAELRESESARVWGSWIGYPFAITLRTHKIQDGVQYILRAGVRREAYEWLPQALRIAVDSRVGVVPTPLRTVDGPVTQIVRYEAIGVPAFVPFAFVLVRLFWQGWHSRCLEVETDVLRSQLEVCQRLLNTDEADGDGKLKRKTAKSAQTDVAVPQWGEHSPPALWLRPKFTFGKWLFEKTCCRKPWRHPQVKEADELFGQGGRAMAVVTERRREAAQQQQQQQRRQSHGHGHSHSHGGGCCG
eukprot:TRINITY_DN6816_c0_g1_i3.p1 TRINITY_DN6816_c0_g1~~TRINITY_DN6816_c0_g1_i3.p1  ORF type:complete len:634 (+),score=110.73 TRINITY_DN6816_c0_g1_i3:242-1903(+)